MSRPLTEQQKAKRRMRVAAWRARNPEKAKAATDSWRARNPERVAAKVKAWRAAHPEQARAIKEAWTEKNRDKIRAQARAWHAANPDRARVNLQNRRAREKAAEGSLSRGLFAKLMHLQRGKCACCRCAITRSNSHMDHIEPLIRGGSNTDENIQLLCATCNLSKREKDPISFMQSRGFLL
ncbi:MAG: HNH endonuclease [Dyella sp.]|uniref:HNH endonuclease n=1 Tax=Dyella sp. TaxID=1869338 RepID=UPI003F804F22